MSADTTVVIAGYRFFEGEDLRFTATVVQAAENVTETESPHALETARAIFITEWNRRPWFQGKGGLSRAKRFAHLLAEEDRENGILEYANRPIIEIGADRVYLLSQKGNRLDERKPMPLAWGG